MALPDLTDVDLRTLRAMDDPGLIAAVDQVLKSSREFGQVWYVGGEGGQRTFPVTGALEGEEGQG
ncbi:hypothetical protein ACFWCA_08465 [Streptomyces phaeochromogenes]|uniref:FXSXX-COOH protein n=1 Tax=Streptomyces phaeochromogenes TaxID=1923 RepID=A0ABZ1HDE5_STRPH|nr:hypothetical protein [Streptomyces phaeochromogenes]WRZ29423.1 hypothetical protein OG931_17530 [Streptomyces phaeochromogenes]WSD15158.1 hypothetical protein OHB35_18975 [Streptomyces phaeochromogenes]WSJ08013.1 hypothetical protein OG437_32440 [Streptomyces phaeochromogenes]